MTDAMNLTALDDAAVIALAADRNGGLVMLAYNELGWRYHRRSDAGKAALQAKIAPVLGTGWRRQRFLIGGDIKGHVEKMR